MGALVHIAIYSPVLGQYREISPPPPVIRYDIQYPILLHAHISDSLVETGHRNLPVSGPFALTDDRNDIATLLQSAHPNFARWEATFILPPVYGKHL